MAKFLIGKEKSAFRKIKHAAAFQGSFNEKKTLLVLSEVAYACLHCIFQSRSLTSSCLTIRSVS